MENDIETDNENKKSRKTFIIVVAVICVLIAAAAAVLVSVWHKQKLNEQNNTGVETYYNSDVEKTTKSNADLPENPVDFKSLQKINTDLYAWLKVPGTRVNYPVAQGADDNFYLHHDFRKNYLFAGTLYTELCNKKDFSDPVTVIYGHNMYKSEGTMFTTLHNFEDETFFNSHSSFKIYTVGHMLSYKVFSVFRYDNRHIMNSFDFVHGDVLADFQSMLLSPHSSVKFVRNVDLNEDSKIVILSTCCSNEKNLRLLVCGVLVKDESTK